MKLGKVVERYRSSAFESPVAFETRKAMVGTAAMAVLVVIESVRERRHHE